MPVTLARRRPLSVRGKTLRESGTPLPPLLVERNRMQAARQRGSTAIAVGCAGHCAFSEIRRVIDRASASSTRATSSPGSAVARASAGANRRPRRPSVSCLHPSEHNPAEADRNHSRNDGTASLFRRVPSLLGNCVRQRSPPVDLTRPTSPASMCAPRLRDEASG